MFWKFPTAQDKTCWERSWKSSKFKKGLNFWNSKFSTLPPNINVDSGQVLLRKAQNFPNNIDLGEKWFIHGKIDSLFCLNSFVQDCRLLIFFWKSHPKLLSGIEMHVGAMYALNSINSKFWKWFALINAHIQHQNMVFLEATVKFYQTKHKKLSLLSLNQPKCLHSIKIYFSMHLILK